MDNTIRMRREEIESLKELFAMLTISQNVQALDQRLGQIAYGKRDMAMVKKKIQSICENLMHTIPTDQLITLSRNMRNISYSIGIKPPQSKRDKDYGMWLTFDAVNGLIDAAREVCMLCDKGGKDQHYCPLRRALDELAYPPECQIKGRCPYYGGI